MASKHKIEFDHFNTDKYFKMSNSMDIGTNYKKLTTHTKLPEHIKNIKFPEKVDYDLCEENNKIISTTNVLKEELAKFNTNNDELTDTFYRRPCRSDCMKSCCNFEEDEYVYKINPIIKMDES